MVAENSAVERPHEAFHVDGRCSSICVSVAAVGIGEQATQFGIGQHATAVLAQTDAGIVEAARAPSSHVDAAGCALGGGMHWQALARGVPACVSRMGVGCPMRCRHAVGRMRCWPCRRAPCRPWSARLADRAPAREPRVPLARQVCPRVASAIDRLAKRVNASSPAGSTMTS